MKKMNKPEVEAVRFDSSDVIATSAGPHYTGNELTPITTNQNFTYYTNNREFRQFSSGSESSPYWRLDFGVQPINGVAINEPDNANVYAWYDGGSWYSENYSYGDTHTEWDTGHGA